MLKYQRTTPRITVTTAPTISRIIVGVSFLVIFFFRLLDNSIVAKSTVYCVSQLSMKFPRTQLSITGKFIVSGVTRKRWWRAGRPGDTIRGLTPWRPDESLHISWGWIYKNAGQTITLKGGEGVVRVVMSVCIHISFEDVRWLKKQAWCGYEIYHPYPQIFRGYPRIYPYPKNSSYFEVKTVTLSVTAPGDTNLSYVTDYNPFQYFLWIHRPYDIRSLAAMTISTSLHY